MQSINLCSSHRTSVRPRPCWCGTTLHLIFRLPIVAQVAAQIPVHVTNTRLFLLNRLALLCSQYRDPNRETFLHSCHNRFANHIHDIEETGTCESPGIIFSSKQVQGNHSSMVLRISILLIVQLCITRFGCTMIMDLLKTTVYCHAIHLHVLQEKDKPNLPIA